MKRIIICLLVALACILQYANAQDITRVCTICNGNGQQECTLCKGKGTWKAEVNGKKKKGTCPHCRGSESQPCWLCAGTGRQVTVFSPDQDTIHPDGYSWIWCSTCQHHGVTRCQRCKGKGCEYAADGTPSVCQLCDGKRYVVCTSCQGKCGWYAEKVRCNVCEASGQIVCKQCAGQGWIPPSNVDRAFAEVCGPCQGHGLVPHKDCGGKGCRHCKNGRVKCKKCDGHGAIIITPRPQYRDCSACSHKGIQNCEVCGGKGYTNVTIEGITLR